MNFNIADADLIYLFASSAELAAGDFSRIKAGSTQSWRARLFSSHRRRELGANLEPEHERTRSGWTEHLGPRPQLEIAPENCHRQGPRLG